MQELTSIYYVYVRALDFMLCESVSRSLGNFMSVHTPLDGVDHKSKSYAAACCARSGNKLCPWCVCVCVLEVLYQGKALIVDY